MAKDGKNQNIGGDPQTPECGGRALPPRPLHKVFGRITFSLLWMLLCKILAEFGRQDLGERQCFFEGRMGCR